jgi:hypothetical protein
MKVTLSSGFTLAIAGTEDENAFGRCLPVMDHGRANGVIKKRADFPVLDFPANRFRTRFPAQKEAIRQSRASVPPQDAHIPRSCAP